jgi:uncharacterized membrane protein
MEIRRADASKGWDWIIRGWHLFMADPAQWIIMTLLYAIIAVALNLIPLGGLVFALGAPALTGGMMYAAQRAERHESLEIGHLFRAFQDRSLTKPMLTLGAISLGLGILIALVAALTLGGMIGAGAMLEEGEMPGAGMVAGGLLGMTVMALIGMVATMVMIYAVPLIMLDRTAPVEAAKASFNACLRNVMPLLVFGLIYLVLGVVAAIPFGLGWLVLFPMTVGALYASYLDIFAPVEPGEETQRP